MNVVDLISVATSIVSWLFVSSGWQGKVGVMMHRLQVEHANEPEWDVDSIFPFTQ